QVSGADVTVVQQNQTTNTTGLAFISIAAGSAAALPSADPQAATGASDQAGVAAAGVLSAPGVAASGSEPRWPAARLITEASRVDATTVAMAMLEDKNASGRDALSAELSPYAEPAASDESPLERSFARADQTNQGKCCTSGHSPRPMIGAHSTS